MVDIPPDLNDGKRGRKYFPNQSEAFRWIGSFTNPLESVPIKSSSPNLIGKLVLEYIAAKEIKSLDDPGLQQMRLCLRRFSERFGGYAPQDITSDHIASWIDSLPYGKRTVDNHWSQARQFFRWRAIRKLAPITPFEDEDVPEKSGGRLPIFTPDEIKALLSLEVDDWIKCKFVLGGFAGLCSCELARMSHECVDYEYKEINVNKEQSKQGKAMRPRNIPLEDAVARHLPSGTGSLIGESKLCKCHRGMPEAARFGDKRFRLNALRHSFASYHLAKYQSPDKTAYAMGHTSPKLIWQTYGNAVTRKDAEIYFNQ